MANPTTSIGFSPSTPAAPSGYANAVPQGDGGAPLARESFYVPNNGIAVVKTSNYTLSIADMGKLIVANSASAITFTLPNPVPLNALSTPTTETRWNVRIANIGTGTLTLAHNSLDIDGVAADLTFAQFTGCEIFTDGTNYFTERGAGSGGVLLKTNSVDNGSQAELNLVAGTDIALSDNGSGKVTIAYTGGGGGGGGTITYVGSNSPAEVSATSVTGTIPSAANVSDLLIAWIYARSTLTPPSGWTFVKSVALATNSQVLYLYTRTALSGDAGASTIWTQASSGRLGIHLQVFRGSAATPTVAFTTFAAATSVSYPNPPFIITDPNCLVVSACTTSTEGTGGVAVSLSGGTLTSPSSNGSGNLRLAAGYTTAAFPFAAFPSYSFTAESDMATINALLQ